MCKSKKKVANDAPTNILLWSEEALILSGKPYISSEFWTDNIRIDFYLTNLSFCPIKIKQRGVAIE